MINYIKCLSYLVGRLRKLKAGNDSNRMGNVIFEIRNAMAIWKLYSIELGLLIGNDSLSDGLHLTSDAGKSLLPRLIELACGYQREYIHSKNLYNGLVRSIQSRISRASRRKRQRSSRKLHGVRQEDNIEKSLTETIDKLCIAKNSMKNEIVEMNLSAGERGDILG